MKHGCIKTHNFLQASAIYTHQKEQKERIHNNDFFSVFYEKTEQHYLHFSEYELWIVLFGKRNLNIDMITMHRVHGRIDFYLFFLYMNDTTHVNPLRFISNYSHCYLYTRFPLHFNFKSG